MKLIDEMPGLASELEAGLVVINEEELAKAVKELVITGRCMCGDKNCGTFYTLDKKVWSGKQLRQVVPIVDNLYAVDVFEGNIVCVEILDKSDVSEKLNKLFGKNT